MSKFVPIAHAKSLYEIDPEFFKSNGVTTLFVDLDNTLDSYKLHSPSDNAKALITKLKVAGLDVVIISNNRYKRVLPYATELGIDFMSSTGKPFPRKINKYVTEKGLNKENIMVVGDQLMTDTLAGNRAKIRVVLTEKIVKEDQPTTHFNRIFDRPIRKHLRKKGLLIDWKDKYGTR